MDTQSRRAKTLEAYRQGPDAIVALVVTVVTELAMQLEALSTRVAALEAENAALRTENAALRAENQALHARLGTSSRNSGKPPSSDGPSP